MKTDLVKLALKIATEAHKGQFRHDGKTLYVTHPIAVAKKFKISIKYDKYLSEVLQAIALLHDVIEDTNHQITSIDLNRKGIPVEISTIVHILTRYPTQTYLEYLLQVREYEAARLVKIEDIKHNLSTLDSKKKSQKDKYLLALYILGG